MDTHHTTTPRTRRRVAVALLLPLLLVLGGCFRLDMGITINENDTADVSMEVGDITGLMSREDMDCSSLESEIAPGAGAEGIDFAVEETETDGNLGCRIVASGAPIDGFSDDSMSIEREGDNFVFTFTGDDTAAPDMSEMPAGAEPQVSISVTFPGEVVEADDNGEVEGNTVTWSGLEAFSAGGTATGAAAGGGGLVDGDSSTIIWIVLGVVVLIALAVLIFLLVKRKQQRSASTGDAGYGQPDQPGQAPGPYGQPGQSGQAPGPYSGAGYGAPADGPAPQSGGQVPPAAPGGPHTPPPSQQPPQDPPGNPPSH